MENLEQVTYQGGTLGEIEGEWGKQGAAQEGPGQRCLFSWIGLLPALQGALACTPPHGARPTQRLGAWALLPHRPPQLGSVEGGWCYPLGIRQRSSGEGGRWVPWTAHTCSRWTWVGRNNTRQGTSPCLPFSGRFINFLTTSKLLAVRVLISFTLVSLREDVGNTSVAIWGTDEWVNEYIHVYDWVWKPSGPYSLPKGHQTYICFLYLCGFQK